MCTIVMSPGVAQVIAQGGYRKGAEQYLFENSRVTIEQISFECKYNNVGGGFWIQIGSICRRYASTAVREWCDLGSSTGCYSPVHGISGLDSYRCLWGQDEKQGDDPSRPL